MSATVDGGHAPKRGPRWFPKTPERRQAENRYKAAQQEDLGLVDQSVREKTSERRDKRIWQIACALLLLVVIILATKDHTDALVYRESANGDLTLVGRPAHDVTPDDAVVAEHLATWLALLREVHDPSDADRLAAEKAKLYAMTQSGSRAAADVDAERLTNDPVLLGRFMRRRVNVSYISKIPGAQRSYEADFEEKTTIVSGAGAGQPPTTQRYHITWSIAKPRLATSESTALLNGAGVYVLEYTIVAKQ